MTTRGNVGGVLFTLALTSTLWASSVGVARAQACDGPCPTPGFVSCLDPQPCTSEGCPPSGFQSTCTGVFTPDQTVNVFSFGTDNSIQVKFAEVSCPFSLTVTLIPTEQAAFHTRLKSETCPTPPAPLSDDGTGPPEVTCNETVMLDVGAADNPTSYCAVYHIDQPVPNNCYSGPIFDQRLAYIVGWKAPAKGNKHDFFLLRDPDSFDPNDDHTTCFIQNITDGTLIRNYSPGEIRDPGLGGRTCCPSDYVVARQRIRPVPQ
jgi:hypothetical protein